MKKRAKGLVALFTFFTVALCTVSMAFAAAVASPEATAKVYPALAKTEKTFYNSEKKSIGTYPVITDAPEALNNKISYDIWKAFRAASPVLKKVSFEIIDEKDATQYATIAVTYEYQSRDINAKTSKEVKNYYFDKEKKAEIASKDDYDKAVAEAKATPEPSK